MRIIRLAATPPSTPSTVSGTLLRKILNSSTDSTSCPDLKPTLIELYNIGLNPVIRIGTVAASSSSQIIQNISYLMKFIREPLFKSIQPYEEIINYILGLSTII